MGFLPPRSRGDHAVSGAGARRSTAAPEAADCNTNGIVVVAPKPVDNRRNRRRVIVIRSGLASRTKKRGAAAPLVSNCGVQWSGSLLPIHLEANTPIAGEQVARLDVVARAVVAASEHRLILNVFDIRGQRVLAVL